MEVKHHHGDYKARWAYAKSYALPQNAKSRRSRQQTRGDGQEESLTTLLNEEQRGQLTLLIASAMAAMRKTISSGFDANVCHIHSLCMSDELRSSRPASLKTWYEILAPKTTR